MKNNSFKILSFLSFFLILFGCQKLDRPELGDYPLDGPIITFISPNPSGTTVILSIEPITSIMIKFQVEDDIEITNISVEVDDDEIANYAEFDNVQSVSIDDLLFDEVSDGEHSVTITATDSDGNITTETVAFIKDYPEPYIPQYDGEVFYMPFEDNYYDLVSQDPAKEIGSPGYGGEGAEGTTNSFVSGTDNYLTFPIDGLTSDEFSAAFWYKVNASPDKSGILTVGTETNEDRAHGFRLFREGSATEQRIKLNVGTGSGESWNDGGVINVEAGEWVHVAFTISSTETNIYFNGELQNTSGMSNMIDWTNCIDMSIGSGAPTFGYWGHLSDSSMMDELRLFNKALTQYEVQKLAGTAYEPMYEGETCYMPFNGNYKNLINLGVATEVGSPTFAGESYAGADAYMGAVDSYLTYPIVGLFSTEFSATFWYKVNAAPDRSGILTVGTDVNEDRAHGFRFFREESATEQRLKLNVGLGADGESWNDGGVITVSDTWVHIAVTVSETESKIYFNGVLQNTATFGSPVDWTDCGDLSIGSGAPTFTYWGHNSDESIIDELRLYNVALTETQIQEML